VGRHVNLRLPTSVHRLQERLDESDLISADCPEGPSGFSLLMRSSPLWFDLPVAFQTEPSHHVNGLFLLSNRIS
jgi:hypothetical protein